ncbi:DEAD-domain-containing protein [Ascobolus immersus RN42]|uniref:ATP-dependent RNA helicase n=1 Tax=Ascobolus immersus RN42 TaxID=1160509 RepID=A0A3N4IPK0_ASCIM|nr:DEAD-domain-containing protein [Ascobolus immersus RN42]
MFGRAVLRSQSLAVARRFTSLTTVRNTQQSLKLTSQVSAAKSSFTKFQSIRSFSATSQWRSAEEALAEDALIIEEESVDELTRFKQLKERGLIDGRIIDVLTDKYNFDTMTDVQARTVEESVTGRDLLVQAKTGTGKTIAFLLPVLHRMLNAEQPIKAVPRLRYINPREAAGRCDIRTIIISPTRELASQIYADAIKLTRGTDIKVHVAVGGTRKREGLMQMWLEGCNMLIATPGRLHDLLTDPESGIRGDNVDTLVLDEADTLLDMGFSQDVERIIKLLPNRQVKDRQTLLFSATVPNRVMSIVKTTLKPTYKFCSLVDPNEEPTHARIPQHLIKISSYENLFPTLYELFLKEMREDEAAGKQFKAIVFMPTVKVTVFAAKTFTSLAKPHALDKVNMFEIHSELSQAQRTRAANAFKAAKNGVLFSSDVVARGMDFPGVTHVIQVGRPRTRETYIHRLGRTGRAGAEGEGFLVVTDTEHDVARQNLKGLPLQPHNSLEAAALDLSKEADLNKETVEILQSLVHGYQAAGPQLFNRMYMALLGYHSDIQQKEKLVEQLNRWAQYGAGFEIPFISKDLASKVGYSRVRGLNFSSGGFDGERKSFDRGDRGDRGERKPFGERSGGFGGERRSFDRGDRGDRKPFGERSGGFGGERRSFDRSGSGGFERKSFGDRGDRPDRGERKPYGERSGGFGGERKSFDRGDRKPYGERSGGFGGERRSFDRSGSGGFEKRSFGDRGDRKPYGERSERFSRDRD